VRVLFSSTSGLGHVQPMVPIALALQRAGHEVRWATGPSACDRIEAQGITAEPVGLGDRERMAAFRARHPEAAAMPGPELAAFMFPKLFGAIAAPAAIDGLLDLASRWRPDVLVHDAAELAAPLAAAAAGLPSVCLGFGELVPERSARAAGDAVAPLWEAAGLEPDPWAGSYRGLYVDLYPASLRGEPMDHVAEVQPRRPAAASAAAAGSLVYVTFGTVFNQIDDGFRAAVLGAAAMADEVLVTVGPTGDPAGIGTVPGNVRVERFVPQAEVLPRCAAVVCHGGSGTLLASLAHGLPLLCLPRGADQFTNADNVARVGAGAVLRPPEVSEAAVRDALATLVGASPARTAASALATEIAAMPSDAEVAAAIAAFAAR
jgi:UDP:flavonoid glycosyltransferase YjiC (YdhE family)